MLKKTMVMGIILTGICTAPTLAHTSYFKSGFLAGAHIGVSQITESFQSNFNTNDPILGSSAVSAKARRTSGLVGIIGGYRHIFNEWYTLGMDISLNFLTKNDLTKLINHIHDFNFRNTLSRQYNVTPSINLGKIICDRFHVSLGLGLAISRFKLRVDDVDNPASYNTSQTRLGFVSAVGVEYAVTHNVSILGNVSYEIYQNMKKTFNVNSSTGLPNSKYTSSIRPQYLTFKVGMVYRF